MTCKSLCGILIGIRIERQKRKARFKQMRKDHYRMKEALKKGRALVKSESEASDGDSE